MNRYYRKWHKTKIMGFLVSVSINAVATRRGPMGRGLFDFWPRFGSVTGGAQPAPSSKPRQKSKILPPRRYIIGVNALAGQK